MPLDPAFNKAVEDMKKISPYVAANKAGVAFDGREFRVAFFDRLFVVRYPEVGVSEEDGTGVPGRVEASGRSPLRDMPATKAVPLWLQIVVLHYVATASGAPIADDWVTFRQLPGGHIYEKAFAQRAVQPLERAFATDLAGFKRACEALGGVKMGRTGDAAYWFMALPRLRMGCVLYTADEEVPASVNMLFDKAASNYLPTEDLSAVGGYLCAALIKARG